MIIMQLRNIVWRRVADVNSVPVISWILNAQISTIVSVHGKLSACGPMGSDSHFVASSTMWISLSEGCRVPPCPLVNFLQYMTYDSTRA